MDVIFKIHLNFLSGSYAKSEGYGVVGFGDLDHRGEPLANSSLPGLLLVVYDELLIPKADGRDFRLGDSSSVR